MSVFLIGSPPSEDFKSMEVYANSLLRTLEKIEGVKVSLYQWPQSTKDVPSRYRWIEVFKKYWMRFIVYPRQLNIPPADVYHILDHSYAHLLKYLPTERTVITCHDLIPLILKEYKKSLGGLFLLETFKYSSSYISKTRQVIVISRATKEPLLKFTSCTPEKITVIPYGVDEDFLKYGRNRKKRGFARDKTTNSILQVGATREPYKNTLNILKAFKILHDEYKEKIQLLKIGASYTAEQERFIHQSGLSGAIKYLGFLPHDKLPEIYGESDLLLMPSLDEGFGWPVLEAMACGTPVVSSKRGAIPEVAGDAVYYVDPLDPLSIAKGVQALLENKDYAETFSERGISRASEFTWRKAAEKTLRVYNQIMQDKQIKIVDQKSDPYIQDLKDRVRKYWEINPMDYGISEDSDSNKYFEKVDQIFEESHYFGHSGRPLLSGLLDYRCLANSRILEVGCGLGTMLSEFSKITSRAIGIDLTFKGVNLTKKRLSVSSLSGAVIQSDAEALPFRDEAFDFIFSWGVLHHTPHTQQAIAEIFRVLKAGGRIGIMLYHRNSICYYYHILLKWGVLGGKFLKYSARDILNLRSDKADKGGTPLAKAYTQEEVKKMFHKFSCVRQEIYGLKTEIDNIPINKLPLLRWFIPSSLRYRLLRKWGWFIWITASK